MTTESVALQPNTRELPVFALVNCVVRRRRSRHGAACAVLVACVLSVIGSFIFNPAVAAGDSSAEAGSVAAEAPEPQIGGGEGSPFMDLLTIGGDRADVEKHFANGKWTLVMLWATDCHVCHEQKPMISEVHDERKGLDLSVFGIAIDGRPGLAKVREYIDTNKPSFPNFVGDLAIVAVNYQMLTEEAFRGTPTYLLFNPSNELMAAQPGRISKSALLDFIEKNS